MISFEWDPVKAITNVRKHGISFDEAYTAFLDENATLYFDIDHSDEEDRYILLGFSSLSNLLVVVHCYLRDDTVIRIISARKATNNEQQEYYNSIERR